MKTFNTNSQEHINVKKPYDLLLLLVNYGGSIVVSNELSVYEIAQAQSQNRFYIDSNGYGFAWIPSE